MEEFSFITAWSISSHKIWKLNIPLGTAYASGASRRGCFASAIPQGAWRAVRVLVMFQLTCFGWLIFRAPSAAALAGMAASLSHRIHITDMAFLIRVATLAAPALAVPPRDYEGIK
jgi:hypothetical protein